MSHRVIEVFYNLADIPGCNAANPADPRALRFRDLAREAIAAPLAAGGLGAPVDSGFGFDEVHIRFAVEDFDAAEKAIWAAVAETRFAPIREIARYWERDIAA